MITNQSEFVLTAQTETKVVSCSEIFSASPGDYWQVGGPEEYEKLIVNHMDMNDGAVLVYTNGKKNCVIYVNIETHGIYDWGDLDDPENDMLDDINFDVSRARLEYELIS